ncbi:MAG: hypothetical protein V3W28_00375 [Thermoplasmata archaeon]
MGEGILISGIVLGVLGMLWSFLLFIVLLLLLAFGAGGTPLLISVIGFLAGIVAIVGAVIGNGRTTVGASILVGVGVEMLVGTVTIAYSALGIGGLDVIRFSLVAGWWAYGLVIAGVVGIMLNRKSEAGVELGD